jgi:hypothetical protein
MRAEKKPAELQARSAAGSYGREVRERIYAVELPAAHA